MEKTGVAVSVDALMNATRTTLIADEQNKITKNKAKMLPKMDFSTFRVDDKVPELKSRVKVLPANIKEKAEVELPIALETKKAKETSNYILITDDHTKAVCPF